MSYQRKQRVNYIFCLCDNIKKNDKVHFFSFFFAQMDFNHVCIFHYWRPFLLLCCSSTKPSICLNTISQLQSNYTPTIKTTSCRSTTHNLCPESGTSAKLLFCFVLFLYLHRLCNAEFAFYILNWLLRCDSDLNLKFRFNVPFILCKFSVFSKDTTKLSFVYYPEVLEHF